MAQSTTMYPFHDNNASLLERRQQTAPLFQLELPSLPPLSQLMTDNKKNTQQEQAEAVAVTMAAMEAAATASMITSTAQPLIQDTFLPTTTSHITSTALPVSNPTLLYNGDFNTTTNPTTINTTANPLLIDNGFIHGQPSLFNTTNTGLTDPLMMLDTRHTRESSVSSTSSDNKVYSFVAIPGTNQRKRPRRRYDEIERLYHCNFSGCTKAYGTLNHLNAHVSMQQHGAKRHPAEFKEMRKEWRRQKKERDAAKKQAEAAYRNNQQQQLHHHHQQQQQQQQQQMMHHYPTATTTASFHPSQQPMSTFTLGNFY
ncbi:unnamed protein product [Mucor hiemalis]